MTELVLVEKHSGYGELVLNRPGQRNSLTGPLVDELLQGLQNLLDDDTVKSVVIRGADGYFCAGLDVKAFFSEPKPDWVEGFAERWLDFHEAIFNCPIPVIGALQGYAIAGGSALALACDFLIVGEKAFLHVSEVERGMAAPINLAWLQLNYGRKTALELAVLGERIYGADLYQKGLAQLCVKDDQVLEKARVMAARFAGFEASAVATLKAGIRDATLGGGVDFRSLVARIKLAGS